MHFSMDCGKGQSEEQLINYASKELVLNLHGNKRLNLMWSTRLVNSFGNLITYNAANNHGFLDYLYFDFGFNRLRFDTKHQFKVKYQVIPMAFLTTFLTLKDGSFDVNKSISTLTPYFIPKENFKGQFSYTRTNHILIHNNQYLAHEMIHTFQHYEYMVINTHFRKRKPEKQYSELSKWGKINRYIYWDFLNRLVITSLYLLEGERNSNYYDNFFEFEANYFSDRF